MHLEWMLKKRAMKKQGADKGKGGDIGEKDSGKRRNITTNKMIRMAVRMTR